MYSGLGERLKKEWKIYLAALIFIIIADSIGQIKIPLGPGTLILFPIFYSIFLGILSGPQILKIFKKPEVKAASKLVIVCICPFIAKLGINAAGALDACTNLKAASKILSECYQRAQKNSGSNSLHDALSCYYSGNFQTGYRHGYVDKVRINAGINVNVPTVPSIREAEAQTKESSTLVASGDKPTTGLIF